MKIKSMLCLAVFLLGLSSASQPGQAAPSAWETVGPGIEYQEFHLPDPNNVFVARMLRYYPEVTIESSLGLGRIDNGRETVSSMARRYDQAINYWGESWGSRNRVVVAINGSYVDTTTGYPDRGVFHSGWYSKRFTDNQNGSGFAWTMDRGAFIGECVKHPSGQQKVVFRNGNYVYLNGINVARGSGQAILYTPQFNSTTRTDNSGVEVLVELGQPSLLPNPGGAITGVIRSVRRNSGSTPIPFDSVVISGQGLDSGTAGKKLEINAVEGEEVLIYQEIRSFYESDCRTPLEVSWVKTFASVGGDFHFLKNGAVQSYTTNLGATTRHPRTAIAFNNDYIFFIVVDGRNPGVSVGMTIRELGVFARDTLGAFEGIAQDGGGSSTMVVNGVVKNLPSDGITPPPKMEAVGENVLYLPLTKRNTSQPPPEPAPVNKVERPVPNGMMMVVVEPSEQSLSFLPNEAVVAIAQADLRLGPGSNYAILASYPANTQGIILSHPLAGVRAKGVFWWKVNLGGAVGWVSEATIGRR